MLHITSCKFPLCTVCAEREFVFVSRLVYLANIRTPLSWDIAIDRNTSKSRFKIDYPYVQPYYMTPEHLAYGITTAEYEDCQIKIFDRDRQICECIKTQNGSGKL